MNRQTQGKKHFECAYANCLHNALEGSSYCSRKCEEYDFRESRLPERRRIVLSKIPRNDWVCLGDVWLLLRHNQRVRKTCLKEDLLRLEEDGKLESKTVFETGKRKMRIWRRIK